MAERMWHLVGRGLAGWHADGVSDLGYKSSGSGGSLDGYAAGAINGAFVYDAKACERTDYETRFISFIVCGPLPDPLLPADCVRPFVSKRGEVIPYHEGMAFGSLDCVGIGVYEKLMRHLNVPLIKFGKVINGEVMWE